MNKIKFLSFRRQFIIIIFVELLRVYFFIYNALTNVDIMNKQASKNTHTEVKNEMKGGKEKGSKFETIKEKF